MSASVHALDPLRDPRWPALVAAHPSAGVFHSAAWLETLRRAYGYEPVAYTTSPAGEDLSNALVFCRIDSWLTGRRLVSLPFSDHVEPLDDGRGALAGLLRAVAADREREGYKYLELRPVQTALDDARFGESASFYLHRLDLGPSLDALFRLLHKDCVQRKIRRAEREALVYEEGRSEALLRQFYRLLLLTSRRRQMPPQPLRWFRHLIDCLGESVKVRVASKDGRAVAAILTLTFKDTMTYKYGCSDATFSNLGATPLLLWRAIMEAKRLGLRTFDMGRSDRETPGLVAFKDRWGAQRSLLRYARSPVTSPRPVASAWRLRIARQCFARMPDPILLLAGRMLYRHVA